MKTAIQRFDATVQRRVRAWPASLHGSMFFLSYVGQAPIIGAFLVGAALYGLAVPQSSALSATAIAAVTCGLNALLKQLFRRARPPRSYHETMPLDTYSFPSGHSAAAAVIFGLLAWITWHVCTQPIALVCTIVAIILSVGMGFSRVYLGAHYPSDVVAGWLVGLSGLGVIVLLV